MLRQIAAFVGIVWGVFALDAILPTDLSAWGLVPRTLAGLVGIATMPFLHGGWGHLIANTISLVVLLLFLFGTRRRPWPVVSSIVVLGGLLLWAGGRQANHIGASALIFGLAAFLIVSGLVQRRLAPLLISIAVAFLYGGMLLGGVLPFGNRGVSWDGHLAGALAGAIAAWFTPPDPRPARTLRPA